MKKQKFTLIELLVVIAIIGILAAFLLSTFSRAQENGRKTTCISQVRQLGLAVIMYRDGVKKNMPNWLSNLYGDGIDSKKAYICPSDQSEGYDGGRPGGTGDKFPTLGGPLADSFPETDDTFRNSAPSRNTAITHSSYMYEFADVDCSWNTGATWAVRKFEQIQAGDIDKGGATWELELFPIIRCFYHYQPGGREVVINSSFATGNFFYSNYKWEDKTYVP